MSTHSSGWTEHETNCSKVCSSSLEQWPARPSGSGVHWAAQSRHDPNFLSRIITGDESWLYDYDLETKQQSSQLKTPSSPWPKKARQVRSNIKWMLIIFFLTFKELCIRVCSTWSDCQWDVLLRVFEMTEGKCEAQMAWGVEEQTGCCTMTMRLHTPCLLWGNSWQTITWPLFPTLPTHLTWPPAISTCS